MYKKYQAHIYVLLKDKFPCPFPSLSYLDQMYFSLTFVYGNKKIFILTIRKRRLTFVGHIIRKGGMENVTLKGDVEVRRDRGKQQIIY